MTSDELREEAAKAAATLMRQFSGADDASDVLKEIAEGSTSFKPVQYKLAATALMTELGFSTEVAKLPKLQADLDAAKNERDQLQAERDAALREKAAAENVQDELSKKHATEIAKLRQDHAVEIARLNQQAKTASKEAADVSKAAAAATTAATTSGAPAAVTSALASVSTEATQATSAAAAAAISTSSAAATSSSSASKATTTAATVATLVDNYDEVFVKPKKGDKAAAVSFGSDGLRVLWYLYLEKGQGSFDALIQEHVSADEDDKDYRSLALIGLHKTADQFAAAAKAANIPSDIRVTNDQMKRVLDIFKADKVKIMDATKLVEETRNLLQSDAGLGSSAKKIKALTTTQKEFMRTMQILLVDGKPKAGQINELAMVTQASIDVETDAEIKKALSTWTVATPESVITRGQALQKTLEAMSYDPPVEFVADDIDDLMSGDVAATRAPFDTQVPADVALAARVGAPAEQSAGSLWNAQPAAASAAPSVADALASFFGGASTAQ